MARPRMMRALLATLTLAALVLAGCSDDHSALDPVTCPDGSVVDVENATGHHDHGFDPATACPDPATVTLEGVYASAAFSWTVDPGAKGSGHAMRTSVHASTSPVSDRDLAADPAAAGTQLALREHQDVPATFRGNLTFQQPGTYYVRAYAEVDGKPVWSNATVVNVTAVMATGTEVVVTKAVGGPLGDFTPATVTLELGDALVLRNDDVLEHTFTIQGPNNGSVTVARMASSDPIVFDVPGTYSVTTDDVQQPKTVQVTVKAPA